MAVLIAGTALLAAPSVSEAALPVSAKTATLHAVKPPAVHRHGQASRAPHTLKARGAGGVSTLGDAVSYGNLAQVDLSSPVVAATTTPDGGGYWLVTQDGRVYSFGDAHNYGQMPRKHIVVGIAVTPDEMGYWLAVSTGQVYTFGDAKSLRNAPKAIVAVAATPNGGGYWLLAATGRVFRLW